AQTFASFAGDGRSIAFECPDTTLVPNDRNHEYDVFVRDLVSSGVELISAREPVLPSSTPNGPSTLQIGSVSGNGEFAAFFSEADNLVANDTNGFRDVFMRDLIFGT